MSNPNGSAREPDSSAHTRRRVVVWASCLSLIIVAVFAVPKLYASAKKQPKRRTTIGATTTLPKKSIAKTATMASTPEPSSSVTQPAVQVQSVAPSTAAAPAPAPQLPCGTLKIMPLGDSLTAFAESYRGPLYRTLVASGYRVDFVGSLNWAPIGGGDADSEGHGGFTIGPDTRLDSVGKPSNLGDNIDSWMQLSSPDLVLLTIGTNDLAGGTAMATQAPQKLRSLVGHMQETYPNASIIVGDVPPNIYNAKSSETRAVNDAAKGLGAQSPTDNIIYAPTASTLLGLGFDPATGTSDGTHFTVPGGELFAQAWLPTLKPVLDSRTC